MAGQATQVLVKERKTSWL